MRRRSQRAGKKAARPKTKLGLPDLDQAKATVLSTLRSPESQRGYRYAIDEFIWWYCSEPRLSFNKTVAPAIEFTSNLASWRPELLTCDSPPCAGLLMRRATRGYSARNLPRAYVGSGEHRNWASDSATG